MSGAASGVGDHPGKGLAGGLTALVGLFHVHVGRWRELGGYDFHLAMRGNLGQLSNGFGLPFVRTSVDHGTALELAGTGKADPGSLIEATKLAIELASAA